MKGYLFIGLFLVILLIRSIFIGYFHLTGEKLISQELVIISFFIMICLFILALEYMKEQQDNNKKK